MSSVQFSAVVWLAAAVAGIPKPAARYDARGEGFIDDGAALSSDGKRLAYFSTDGATQSTLHLVGEEGREVAVKGAPIDAVDLQWLSRDRVLVVRSRDGQRTAQPFSLRGPEKPVIGPFDQMAFGTVGGRAALVTYRRSQSRGVEHTITAYSLDHLTPIAHRSYREDGEGQIRLRGLTVMPQWWSSSFTELHALRGGEYDKARDVRRPSRHARLDVFSGKLLEDSEIPDVLAFVRAGQLRRELPNQPVLFHFSDDQKQLFALDAEVDREIKLPTELRRYDAHSLAWQNLDDGRVFFSLTVDPVNAAAVARQRADRDFIELFEFDRRTGSVRLATRLEGQGRRSTWKVAGDQLMLVRKAKGFDRGGVAIELYPLTAAAHASQP